MLVLRACTLLSLVAAVGCGDFTSAFGDEGLIQLSIYSDRDIAADDLREVGIVAGHLQRFSVSLTERGETEVRDPDLLTYALTPDPGTLALDGGSPPDFKVNVATPGMYRFDVLESGRAIDGVDLRFVAPASLELVVKARAPYSDRFETLPAGQPSQVSEGTEVVFLPVPLDEAGVRLAGDIKVQASFDPEWAVVPDVNVEAVWEGGILTTSGEGSFFIIEPGTITLTVVDSVGAGMGTHTFEVAPVMH